MWARHQFSASPRPLWISGSRSRGCVTGWPKPIWLVLKRLDGRYVPGVCTDHWRKAKTTACRTDHGPRDDRNNSGNASSWHNWKRCAQRAKLFTNDSERTATFLVASSHDLGVSNHPRAERRGCCGDRSASVDSHNSLIADGKLSTRRRQWLAQSSGRKLVERDPTRLHGSDPRTTSRDATQHMVGPSRVFVHSATVRSCLRRRS